MRLLQEHEYVEFFELIEPYGLAAPYGFNWNFYKPKTRTLVITKKDYINNFKDEKYKVRTYEKNHRKLALGTEGALVGSWNWSLSHRTASTQNEIVIFVNPRKDTTLYEQLRNWFDSTWNTAHSVISNKAITKLHEVP